MEPIITVIEIDRKGLAYFMNYEPGISINGHRTNL